MQKFVWMNPYLPQTLQIAVTFAYFRVGFAILFGGIVGVLNPISIIILGSTVLGAFGIANVRWWGYIISVIIALLPFIFGILLVLTTDTTFFEYIRELISGSNLINTMISVAIVALLVHPMSWNYVKNNFEKTIP